MQRTTHIGFLACFPGQYYCGAFSASVNAAAASFGQEAFSFSAAQETRGISINMAKSSAKTLVFIDQSSFQFKKGGKRLKRTIPLPFPRIYYNTALHNLASAFYIKPNV